jgi:DNA repair exonuclease SbcCD ATPase subunit
MAEEAAQVLDEGQEDEAVLDSKADPALQAQAQRLGWMPPERYKGAPEKFVDADEFVRRGEEVLPIIRQQKAKLESDVGRLSGEVSHLKEIIAKNQEAMTALEEYHTGETKRKVAQVRKELKSEIARASEAGDHEALAEATDQLSQLNERVEETAPVEKQKELPPAEQLDPGFIAWAEDTGWYGKDRRRTALANAVAVEMREKGEKSTGREFLDLVAAEVETELPRVRRARPSPEKVAGGRLGSGSSGGRKGYADLSAEAKVACDTFADQLVGEGRRYKTLADWRAKYAKDHFEEV